eukprot:TRINITY_DN8736_c0_g1_i1.p1 TRINITY_DN8736_c0_g1~~TRINITY_DN8736_c0_g1_i1.p1  ORF type:complete len:301 (+),score=58.08 TRINITY_DN8736_c0_g1_i1:77-979(+)
MAFNGFGTSSSSMPLPISLTLVLFCCWISIGACWGPYTHQIFGVHFFDQSEGGETPISACCGSTNVSVCLWSYVLGGSSPDVFKDVSPQMHSLEFAGYQLLFAKTYENSPSSSFDALAYAAGFGSHLTEDAVGHYNGGFLNPEYDHPLELAVDTLLVKNYSVAGNSDFVLQEFDDDGIAFVVAATSYAASQMSGFVALNSSMVQQAISSFNSLTTEEKVLIDLNFSYELEIVKYDPYSPANFTEAASDLTKAETCCGLSSMSWLNSICYASPLSPIQAYNNVSTYITQLFSTPGLCSPVQ